MPFIIIVILISVHEVGHFLTAKFFHFELDKIYFYPYGGISKFNMEMNVELYKEIIVLIMGPLFQVGAYLILTHLYFFQHYLSFIQGIHYATLFFNFLPIYPLDGGKLLNLLFNYSFNFRKSFRVVIFISYFSLFLLFLYYLGSSFSFSVVFMIFFLLYKITDEFRQESSYYHRFLLERYLKRYPFKKRKIVGSVDDFYRDCSHIIQNNGHYYTEHEILQKKFMSKY